uniref:Ubiquitin-like domain-containing protein n=1 Tax=Araucaria cunninghamii TaxID=56994 RepID=A0A0D6R1F7_ARACU
MEEEEKKVTINVKKIGSARPRQLQVPPTIKVSQLRRIVGTEVNLPIEWLKIFLHGAVLHDVKNGCEVHASLNEGDSLLAIVAPKPPAKHIQDTEDDDEDDLRLSLPETAAQWKKNLLFFLQNKLGVPDIVLVTILSISLKKWIMVFLWFIIAPLAYRWDLGPVYILTTAFTLIFFNLGQRQQGDASAYSIFNENFRELPGTLNADRLDRDLRAGQLF